MALSRRRIDTPLTNPPLDVDDWYLEGIDPQGDPWVIPLKPLPFIIGRQEGCHLHLTYTEISRRHAEIHNRTGQLWLRECGSTNGTFVNRRRVQEDLVLYDGDVVQFGTVEFRLRRRSVSRDEERTSRVLSQGFDNYATDFDDLIRRGAVVPHYQPLVRLADRQLIGYELLGRGAHEVLPTSPGPLLRIAANLGRDVELSELFRRAGTRSLRLAASRQLFFNTVPREMDLTYLRRALVELRRDLPDLALVMEVHETAVTDLATMRQLRPLLNEFAVGLAYDDFGAGQARLLELMDVPPDYLKFHLLLIRNIHQRSQQSLQMLTTLVRMARDLGIKTLAEGIEQEDEATVCRQIGFEFAQGYLFGMPASGQPV